ncbi:MAG: hypothetical protein PVJ57_21040, partial [Phycisphaerae bacterium]
MARARIIAILVCMTCSAVAAQSANWVIEQYSGGFCYIEGSYDPLTAPTHYQLDHVTGDLTLKVDGNWTVIYRSEESGGDPVDIPFIQGSVTTNQPFTLHLTGDDLTEWLYLDTVSGTGARVLQLNLSGSIAMDGWVMAPDFTLTNSVVSGDAGGERPHSSITVATVANDATTGVGLNIGGSITKSVYVKQDLIGTINVGQNLSGLLDIDGDVLSGSAINVTGALSGDVSIGGDLAGTLSAGSWVAGSLTNDIFIS